jgi:hypothetical protein
MAKIAKYGRKFKAMSLIFCCFFHTYEKWQKSLKMYKKLRLLPYFFAVFCPHIKMEKVAKNGRKVKAIAFICLVSRPSHRDRLWNI